MVEIIKIGQLFALSSGFLVMFLIFYLPKNQKTRLVAKNNFIKCYCYKVKYLQLLHHYKISYHQISMKDKIINDLLAEKKELTTKIQELQITIYKKNNNL
jgi:hypothetical protein